MSQRHSKVAAITAAVVSCLLIVVAGCGVTNRLTTVGDGAFAVDVSKGAARASRDQNVDLERLVSRSAEAAFRLLPHRGRVHIRVRLDAAATISEIGVGGFTDPGSGDVFISIDPTPQGGLRGALETWVPAALAHELHHSSRIRTGPGYGVTLGEALVTEGLADHFVQEVYPATPPQPWDNAFPKSREPALWRRAQRALKIPGGYDHRAWFFGTSDLPRWAGYTLGYSITAVYLGAGHEPSRSTGTPAERVIAAYRAR